MAGQRHKEDPSTILGLDSARALFSKFTGQAGLRGRGAGTAGH